MVNVTRQVEVAAQTLVDYVTGGPTGPWAATVAARQWLDVSTGDERWEAVRRELVDVSRFRRGASNVMVAEVFRVAGNLVAEVDVDGLFAGPDQVVL